ncbi:hypothetical protein SVAN01_00002 [Stagonosporopsis vannaccii]|nr:hypothetical protein SVAN01_00002 [Stagonosporopsis vannaccii]
MPPKRMSDILHSSLSATTPATAPPTAPHSSEGPSLPIITPAAATATAADSDPNASKKRKRTAPSSPSKPKQSATARKQTKHERDTDRNDKRVESGTNHPSLYTPWVLLPPRERKGLAAVGAGEGMEKENVQVLVWSRNQNVKAGVRRLENVLCAGRTRGKRGEGEGMRKEGQGQAADGNQNQNGDVNAVAAVRDSIIAVSAQGEGTVKLVGIVDMVRRIVGHTPPPGMPSVAEENQAHQGQAGQGQQAQENPAHQGEVGEGQREQTTWFVYPVLSSVVVPRRKESRSAQTLDSRTGTQQHDGDEEAPEGDDAMDIDIRTAEAGSGAAEAEAEAEGSATKPDIEGGDGHGKQTQKANRQDAKPAPVLTVWFSSRHLPGWRDAFGEQKLGVRTPSS